ncbi:MAG: ankyrin repeat domain-containing protein [Candidatus Latescibacteria bacterium]|nr:ankyrin repeat domain-containing protein [Candidatus Latescibacterota bacterium]
MDQDHQDILSASFKGDIETVRKLLKKNPELVNAKNSEGGTPLMLATFGHMEIIKLLLEYGADIHAVSQDGTALHLATWEQQQEIVQFLLDQGLDPNSTSASGETALMAAAYKGFASIGRLLLERGVAVNGQTTQGNTDMFNTSPPVVGESALHLAAAYGHRAFVELLLEHGADKDLLDHAGQKPLHWAARHRQDKLFDLLR